MAENGNGSFDLAQTIQTLETASRPKLAEQWQRLYRNQPPKGVSQRSCGGGSSVWRQNDPGTPALHQQTYLLSVRD
jgi:hypothetical protein